MRPGALLLFSTLVACTRVNPAFDGDGGTASIDGTDATNAITGGPGDGTGVTDEGSTASASSVGTDATTSPGDATMGCAGTDGFQGIAHADTFLRVSKSPLCGAMACDGLNYGATGEGLINDQDLVDRSYHLIAFDVSMLGTVQGELFGTLSYRLAGGAGTSKLDVLEVSPPAWGEGLGNQVPAAEGEASWLASAAPAPWTNTQGTTGPFGVVVEEGVLVTSFEFEASEAPATIHIPIPTDALARWVESAAEIHIVVTKSSGEGDTRGFSRETDVPPTLIFEGC